MSHTVTREKCPIARSFTGELILYVAETYLSICKKWYIDNLLSAYIIPFSEWALCNSWRPGDAYIRIIDPAIIALEWRYNERHCVSNHRRFDCLLNRLFRRRTRKTPKPRFPGLCEGNSLVTGEFPSQRVTRKMFPFDDVIVRTDFNDN